MYILYGRASIHSHPPFQEAKTQKRMKQKEDKAAQRVSIKIQFCKSRGGMFVPKVNQDGHEKPFCMHCRLGMYAKHHTVQHATPS